MSVHELTTLRDIKFNNVSKLSRHCLSGKVLLFKNLSLIIVLRVICKIALYYAVPDTGGSRLSPTAVKLDSHLARIFVAKFLCIIKLIIIIG